MCLYIYQNTNVYRVVELSGSILGVPANGREQIVCRRPESGRELLQPLARESPVPPPPNPIHPSRPVPLRRWAQLTYFFCISPHTPLTPPTHGARRLFNPWERSRGSPIPAGRGDGSGAGSGDAGIRGCGWSGCARSSTGWALRGHGPAAPAEPSLLSALLSPQASPGPGATRLPVILPCFSQ